MIDDIRLGELEFKAEDLEDFAVFHLSAPIDDIEKTNPNFKVSPIRGEPELLEHLNALLRERLKAAPVLFNARGEVFDWKHEWQFQPSEGDTHTARLVCIEQISKLEDK